MNFCSQCNSESPADARFCPACGTRLGDAEPAAATTHASRAALRSPWFVLAVGAFALGSALTAGLMALSKSPPGRQPAASGPNSQLTAAMPPGHPAFHLPGGHPGLSQNPGNDAVVTKAEKQAQQNPKNIDAWNRYGDLAMRFAMFNPADYPKSQAAFAHVLHIDPDNREALRGIGDIYFDLRQYSNAIDAYSHYLRINPDDSQVLTDLGTMYLSQHNNAQAIKEYRMALMRRSDFFPAEFNLGVAYLLLKDNQSARDALVKARAIAPNGPARTRVDEMLARIDQRTAMADARHGTDARSVSSSEQTPPQ